MTTLCTIRENNHQFTVEETVRICHRNFGLGSDGILVGRSPLIKATLAFEFLTLTEVKQKKVVTVYEFLHVI